ncbi:MAG: PGPGW domain-containing protein [Bacteroidetes bacterium]|nr:PGPGW domain-containing protein [Bacteroidota bacterium]
MNKTIRQIRRIIVAVVGFTLLFIGVAMLVLPGPAIIVIPAALAILATEFVWARRLLDSVKGRFRKKG